MAKISITSVPAAAQGSSVSGLPVSRYQEELAGAAVKQSGIKNGAAQNAAIFLLRAGAAY